MNDASTLKTYLKRLKDLKKDIPDYEMRRHNKGMQTKVLEFAKYLEQLSRKELLKKAKK